MPEKFSFPGPEKNKTPKEEGAISRRNFLKSSAVGAAGVVLGGTLAEAQPVFPEEITELLEKAGAAYKTGPLEGHNFPADNLFHYLTGILGKAPAIVNVDFQNRLKFLFAKKEEFVKRHHKTNTAFRQTEQALLKEYTEKPKAEMDMRAYQLDVKVAIQEVMSNLDWEKVRDSMKLKPEELILLKEISQALSPKHLTAYALTELMPSDDGALNRDVYEFLLKNAGSRYVYSIPAIYDDRLSFGPYQFTSYALKDTGDAHPEGASKINRALPEAHRIPGSVSKLRGSLHHKAALCFAIYNLASSIGQLIPKELALLKTIWPKNMTALTEFIATAHHMPAPAYSSMKRWLDAGAKKSFEVSCPGSIREYAQKTKANLSAL